MTSTTYDPCPAWQRPSGWPTLPTVTASDQKIAGLVAIEDTLVECVAIRCEGDYTVDWGDGSSPEDVASGVRAEHAYDYASTPGIVVVVVTPQEGQDLTSVDFQQQHSLVEGLSHLAKWLELDMSLPACTSLTLGAHVYEFTSEPGDLPTTYLGRLQSLTLRSSAVTSFSNLCSYCYALEHVSLAGTEAVTTTYAMFYSCHKLKSVPLFDTSSVTNMEFMFGYCYTLACVPLFVTSSVTSMEGMFHNCYALTDVPLMDTSSVANMADMFREARSLRTVPLLDLSACTDANHMFTLCTALKAVPPFSMSLVQRTYNMFSYCHSLTSVPALDLTSAWYISRMFYECLSLTVLPALNLGAVSASNYGSEFALRMPSLRRSYIYGAIYTQDYSGSSLSEEAINEVFTNLGVTNAGLPSYSRTVNITGCPGAAACDRSIATAKNWVVVG